MPPNVAVQRPMRLGAQSAYATCVMTKDVRCNGVLGAWPPRLATCKAPNSGANDGRNRVRRNALAIAVLGLEPVDKQLCTFARVAADATSRDVLERDNACIIDDVLPRRSLSPRCRAVPELDTTVDTTRSAFNHLTLEPVRDTPSVHRVVQALYGGQAPNV